VKKNRTEDCEFHLAYKTTRFDGKFYIGIHSTDIIEDGYLGSGVKLWKSINYHGREKHNRIVLEVFKTRKDAVAYEKEIVTWDLIRNDPLCLNLIPGGAYLTRKPDHAEGKKNRSKALKAFYNSARSEPARKKIREANKNKIISDEHKKILSKTLTQTVARLKSSGEWEAVKAKNAEAHRGKIQTDDHVAKRVLGNKKTKLEKYGGHYTFSEQARKNIGASQQGNEKHAKSWTITRISTGATSEIRNLTKWMGANNLVRMKDKARLKDTSSGLIVFTVMKL
jgi:hypothetical protein